MNNNITLNSNYPSFSSSLLEEIYRSFDDDKDRDRDSHSRRPKFTKINRKISDYAVHRDNHALDEFDRRRVDRFVLQHWIDIEKAKEKDTFAKLRRNSMPESGNYRPPLYSSSSTSSSDSSSGIGGFSSSDTDSFVGAPAMSKAKIQSLKPIRTASTSPEFSRKSYSDDTPAKKKSKKDGRLHHALKLYGELKKVKQPISPGGKLATFLNALFHSRNPKKPKIDTSRATSSQAKMASSSVPSTASSYSRSCLSKTPSSAGRFERRSVRFCPVSVVVDESGQKSVYNDEVSRMDVWENDELKAKIIEKQRRVEEAAKELLKNYRNNNNNNNQIRKEIKVNVISPNYGKFGYKGNDNNMRGFEEEEEEEEDDEESCCSSDLFELDNLLEIDVADRYRQELPVYETTHVRTNRSIAKGSFL